MPVDDEQETDTKEEKPQRGGPRLILLHRNLLPSSKGSLKPRETCKNWLQLKKFPRSQAAKTKSNIAEAGDINESLAKEKIPEVEQLYACPSCGQSFKSKLSLSNHQRIHIREAAYKCSICGETFTARKVLASHHRKHAEEKGYKRPGCEKRATKHPKVVPPEGSHKCLKCEKCFHLRKDLLKHQRSHAAEGPHKCPVCGKGFIRKEHLTRHQKIHTRQNTDQISKGHEEARVETSFSTPEKKPSRAPVFERSVMSDIGNSRHQRIHTNLYKCRFCGKSLRSKIMLIEHERTHTEKRPYKCSWCKKSFYYKQRLQNHEKTHSRQVGCKRSKRMRRLTTKSSTSYFGIFQTAEHSSRGPVGRNVNSRSLCLTQRRKIHVGKTLHKCQYCGKCLSSKDGLINHERIHRGEKPYRCDECGNCFRQKSHLVKHLETHIRQKPYQRIERTSRLKVPNRTNKGQKPYKGLTLWDSTRHSQLTRHPKMPIESNVFECQYCGKCTRTKSSLLIHERIHKGRKRYQCLECGKKFSQKNYLGCHQRSHVRKKDSKHSDSDNKVITKYSSLKCSSPHKAKLPYMCLKCGKRFTENYYFKRHQKIHSGKKPFSCTTCGKAFIQTWHLRRHEKIHLKKTHLKHPKVPEVDCVFSHSTNDLFSLEKNPVNMASRTMERNASQNIKEEETESLAVLIEGPEVRVSQSSEGEEMCIKAETELQVFSSRKSKGKAQLNQGVVRQLEKLGRKPTRKGNVLQGYKQDQHYRRQPAQPRKSSKNACGLRGCKKEKGCASQQLGLQTTTRKSKREIQLAGKQAKSCFCQLEKPEITPGRQSKNPQTGRKANTFKRPQKPHVTASSKLPKKVPKFCKPTSPCFDPPSQSTFLPDSKMAPVEQRMELQEVLEREPKKSSVSWSCRAIKCEPGDATGRMRRQAVLEITKRNTQPSHKGLRAANELDSFALQNLGAVAFSQQKRKRFVLMEVKQTPSMLGKAAPRSPKKGRECQRTTLSDPHSRATKKKVATDQDKSEQIQVKHICSVCKKSFRSRGNLLIHEKNHTGNRPFLCIYCGKSFYNISTLRVHVRIHTGEKPFKCSECTFCCNVSSNLSRHRKTHVRERPHPCLQCGKRFWFSHSLLVHSRIHIKKEPHKCIDCERVFTHKNFLKLHRRYKHHSEVPRSGEK